MKKLVLFVLVFAAVVSCGVLEIDDSGVVAGTPDETQKGLVVNFDRETFEREKQLCLSQDFQDYYYQLYFGNLESPDRIEILKKDGVLYFRGYDFESYLNPYPHNSFVVANEYGKYDWTGEIPWYYEVPEIAGSLPDIYSYWTGEIERYRKVAEIAGSLADIYSYLDEVVNREVEGIRLTIGGDYDNQFHYPGSWVYTLTQRELTPEELKGYEFPYNYPIGGGYRLGIEWGFNIYNFTTNPSAAEDFPPLR